MKAAGTGVKVLRFLGAASVLGAAIAFVPGLVSAQMTLAKASLPADTGNRAAAKPAADTSGTGAAKAKRDREFARAQQENQRVLLARLEKKFEMKKLFAERGVEYPAAETFLRIFKRERILEVWARGKTQGSFTLLKSYSICALAGALGPKRSQGDGQTPEGVYYIDGFNPASEYHLSLHLDYPNKADQVHGNKAALGGNIYIHGGCRTEGCLAVTDDAIKELYWLSVVAREAGQEKIPVHIFPARLSDDELFRLTQVFDKEPDLKRFWANLKTTYDFFENSKKLPIVTIDERGRYRVAEPVVVAPAVVQAVDTLKPGGN